MNLRIFPRSEIGTAGSEVGQEWRRSRERASGGRVPIDLHLLDHHLRVESEDSLFLDQLTRCFEPLPVAPTARTAGAIDLRVSVERTNLHAQPSGPSWTVTTDPPGVLERLGAAMVGRPTEIVGALNRWAVNEASRHYVFHAGAVARRGRALLLPAGSHRVTGTPIFPPCRTLIFPPPNS